jgi:hypothetical protein
MGNAVKTEKFPKGKRHHQDVSATSAQLRGYLPLQETGIAPGNDNAVTILVVEGPQDAAPSRQLLDFIKEKERRRLSGNLLEGGQKEVGVGSGKIRQAVIFKIHKKDILPEPWSSR